MLSTSVTTFAVAVLFALVHVASPRLRPPSSISQKRWLSFAGGLSVGYVFAHLLPEMAGAQADLPEPVSLGRRDSEIFLVALAGVAVFYGLEHLARTTVAAVGDNDRKGHTRHPGFWLHVFAFSLYSAMIGFLMVQRDPEPSDLAFYAVALGVHFYVNDRSLARHHGGLHDLYGRWILSTAVLAGWGLGVIVSVPSEFVGFLYAFLGGAIILNVLKEELPEERQGRVGAFALGAGLYVAASIAI